MQFFSCIEEIIFNWSFCCLIFTKNQQCYKSLIDFTGHVSSCKELFSTCRDYFKPSRAVFSLSWLFSMHKLFSINAILNLFSTMTVSQYPTYNLWNVVIEEFSQALLTNPITVKMRALSNKTRLLRVFSKHKSKEEKERRRERSI